jgi:glyoxylase-like metal-dependent hydrolase (beta-lactamase superfamily II)
MINYTYLLISEHSRYCAIIDPSWEPEKILCEIEKFKVIPVDIFITHAHGDHIFSLDFFVHKFNSRVWISAIEADYYNVRLPNMNRLNPNQLFKLEDILIQTVHTPGHTKGGFSYLSNNNLFTGDTLFAEGCGSCLYPGGSAEDMFNSVQKIKGIANGNTCIYPGHSFGATPGLTFGELLQMNIYLQLNDKESFISFSTRKNKRESSFF